MYCSLLLYDAFLRGTAIPPISFSLFTALYIAAPPTTTAAAPAILGCFLTAAVALFNIPLVPFDASVVTSDNTFLAASSSSVGVDIPFLL